MADTQPAPSGQELAEALARADAEYEPFPPFSEWRQTALDTTAWDRYVDRLEAARQVVDQAKIDNALTVALRAAAVDTGAIEGLYEVDRGFTITVAKETIALQQMAVERGDDFAPLFEAQLEGYEMALDIATAAQPVSEAWVRQVHAVITAPQDKFRVLTPLGRQELPLPKGEYKTHPNHVLLPDERWHSFAPVDLVRDEMHRLTRELQTVDFGRAHPALQASYAHFAFVTIHPFADGNGRVARVLASAYLLRSANVPFVVFADQKDRYLTSLEAADAGDYRAFVSFVSQRATATMRMIADTLQPAPDADAAVNAILAAYESPAGLSYEELDARANRLVDVVTEELTASREDQKLPNQIAANWGITGMGNPPTGWRLPVARNVSLIQLNLNSSPPAAASVGVNIAVVISASADPVDTFRVYVLDRPEFDVLISLEDLYPDETAELRFRVRHFVDRLLGTMLTELQEVVDHVRRTRGF